MHDGRIIEDSNIKKYEKVENFNKSFSKDAKLFSKLRLGIRNTFNIFGKFILLFAVFLFMSVLFYSISK